MNTSLDHRRIVYGAQVIRHNGQGRGVAVVRTSPECVCLLNYITGSLFINHLTTRSAGTREREAVIAKRHFVPKTCHLLGGGGSVENTFWAKYTNFQCKATVSSLNEG